MVFFLLLRHMRLTLGYLVFQVVRAAEEAASTLASSIHPEQCIKVLCPIIQTADYPINLAAIKMQTKVVERIAKESLLQLLADIIPGLLQVSCSQVMWSLLPSFTGQQMGKPQAETLSLVPVSSSPPASACSRKAPGSLELQLTE